MDKAGRITLPKAIRERLTKMPRLKMRVRDEPGGQIVIEIGYDPLDLKGIIKDRGIRLTIEEIGEAIKKRGSNT